MKTWGVDKNSKAGDLSLSEGASRHGVTKGNDVFLLEWDVSSL